MLLVLTTSFDVTMDIVIQRLSVPVFRLNFDLWRDYCVIMRPHAWEISNPVGLRINSNNATHCLWWKAFNPKIEGDVSVVAEIKYVFRELYNWFGRRGLIVGNSPDFHNHLGKLHILEIAAPFFRIPSSSIAGWNLPPQLAEVDSQGIVAKSLSSEFTDDNRALYTTAVDYQTLDRSWPWFLQSKTKAGDDVTVFVCDGEFFPYARSRGDLEGGLDWRRHIGRDCLREDLSDVWKRRSLSLSEQQALRGLCQQLNTKWGRFDFLEDDDGLIFLEFNANGMWAFLDPYQTDGLTRAVVAYLSKPPLDVPSWSGRVV